MELRWLKGCGNPPAEAIMLHSCAFSDWQVLQYLQRSKYEGKPDVWVNVPVCLSDENN